MASLGTSWSMVVLLSCGFGVGCSTQLEASEGHLVVAAALLAKIRKGQHSTPHDCVGSVDLQRATAVGERSPSAGVGARTPTCD